MHLNGGPLVPGHENGHFPGNCLGWNPKLTEGVGGCYETRAKPGPKHALKKSSLIKTCSNILTIKIHGLNVAHRHAHTPAHAAVDTSFHRNYATQETNNLPATSNGVPKPGWVPGGIQSHDAAVHWLSAVGARFRFRCAALTQRDLVAIVVHKIECAKRGAPPPGTGDTKYNFVVLGVFFFHIWHFWDNKIDHEIKKVEKI